MEYENTFLRLNQAERLAFGRGQDAQLRIDPENRYLHRLMGYVYFEGVWWVENVGTSLALTVVDGDATMVARVSSGARLALPAPVAHIQFSAGPTAAMARYEITALQAAPMKAPLAVEGIGATTITMADRAVGLVLTEAQRVFLVALCEQRLRDPNDTRIPPSKEIARRLGWNLTRFNRKLDNVCARFHKAGFPGMYEEAGLTTNRRHALVDLALRERIVNASDLALLDNAAIPLDPTQVN